MPPPTSSVGRSSLGTAVQDQVGSRQAGAEAGCLFLSVPHPLASSLEMSSSDPTLLWAGGGTVGDISEGNRGRKEKEEKRPGGRNSGRY